MGKETFPVGAQNVYKAVLGGDQVTVAEMPAFGRGVMYADGAVDVKKSSLEVWCGEGGGRGA